MKKIKPAFRLNFSAFNGKNSKCNLKCFNCHKDYFDIDKQIDESNYTPFTDAINLIYSIADIKSDSFNKIHISGHAEPTMIGKEKFMSEIKALRKNFPQLPIALTTNGSYLKDIRDEFLALNNTFINLSLHHLAYLKTNWFSQLCTLDKEKRHRLELNIIIDSDIIANLDDLLLFIFSRKVNAKFFHRLEEENPQKVVFNFIDLLRTKLKSKNPSEQIDEKRFTFLLGNGNFISVKLPVDLFNRPAACFRCSLLTKCVESCWTSIRITPWYIKPCGLREDNVYLFSENSKESLKQKLLSGGKL